MKTILIVNPGAGSARIQEAEKLGNLYGLDVQATDAPGAATSMCRQALGDGYDRVIAMGGDGTQNEVVNGFFDDEGEHVNREAVFGFLMRGTGNDLQKTYGYPHACPEAEKNRMIEGKIRLIDIGRLRYTDFDGQERVHHFVNLASFGMSGAVDRAVAEVGAIRKLGGKAAFLWATVKTFAGYKCPTVRVKVDNEEERQLAIRLVCVANGQYAGGGMWFAPRAQPDDGLFDLLVVPAGGRFHTIRQFGKIYKGTHIAEDALEYRTCRRLEAGADSEVLLDVDGEALGKLPATFEIMPEALRIQV